MALLIAGEALNAAVTIATKPLCRCHLENLSGRTAIYTEPPPAKAVPIIKMPEECGLDPSWLP